MTVLKPMYVQKKELLRFKAIIRATPRAHHVYKSIPKYTHEFQMAII